MLVHEYALCVIEHVPGNLKQLKKLKHLKILFLQNQGQIGRCAVTMFNVEGRSHLLGLCSAFVEYIRMRATISFDRDANLCCYPHSSQFL